MFELTVFVAWVAQAPAKNCQFAKYHQRSNAPWRERFACKCTASEAQYMQRGSKNEVRTTCGRTGASQRLLLRATIVSAKGAGETSQPFEPHLNTALPHAQRSRVPRSRQRVGERVGSLRASQSLRMSRTRGGVAPIAALWRLRQWPCPPERFGQRAPRLRQWDNRTMTLREVQHLSMEGWPYRHECRGHDPAKKICCADAACSVGKLSTKALLGTVCSTSDLRGS